MSNFFEWPLRVYIEDTDAGGIVYYVNYLKFMERARTEYLRGLGFGKQYIFNQELMFVVQSIKGEYLKPATLDDELSVTAKVIDHGACYLTMEQLVSRDGELLCQGEVKIVCVSKPGMNPKRIPRPMKQALGL
ncbi:MAG: tol-pal system-associated acyl-CoA thioesterase [Pseudohongiellaceae bacterium]|jgi:tol-pal system-associated acyl-CoA thioesterase